MNTKNLENLNKILSKLPSSLPGLFQYKLGIIKKLIAPYIEPIEDVKKGMITERLVEFDKKRTEFVSSSRTKDETEQFIEDNKEAVIEYEKFVKTMDDIYKYEVDVKFPKFTLEEIPDELEELSMDDFSIILDMLVDD